MGAFARMRKLRRSTLVVVILIAGLIGALNLTPLYAPASASELSAGYGWPFPAYHARSGKLSIGDLAIDLIAALCITAMAALACDHLARRGLIRFHLATAIVISIGAGILLYLNVVPELDSASRMVSANETERCDTKKYGWPLETYYYVGFYKDLKDNERIWNGNKFVNQINGHHVVVNLACSLGTLGLFTALCEVVLYMLYRPRNNGDE